MNSIASNATDGPPSRRVIVMRVDGTSYDDAVHTIFHWARHGESRSVCIANVHMAMECYDRPDFREIVNGADLVTPDGMPLVWVMRKIGLPLQQRVCGPALTLRICEQAAKEEVPLGFYGGTQETIDALRKNLEAKFPGIKIAFAKSPPFRALSEEEDAQDVSEINESGAKILLVGLGCPKQETWMAAHRGRVQTVMLGVGAAFDIHAGNVKPAPQWMQKSGLEWLYRLMKEPGRLWKRYFKHNPRFLVLAAMQITGIRRFS